VGIRSKRAACNDLDEAKKSRNCSVSQKVYLVASMDRQVHRKVESKRKGTRHAVRGQVFSLNNQLREDEGGLIGRDGPAPEERVGYRRTRETPI